MPLSHRYQADRMFNVKILHFTIAMDTMHAKVNSIHGNYYCQVFDKNNSSSKHILWKISRTAMKHWTNL